MALLTDRQIDTVARRGQWTMVMLGGSQIPATVGVPDLLTGQHEETLGVARVLFCRLRAQARLRLCGDSAVVERGHHIAHGVRPRPSLPGRVGPASWEDRDGVRFGLKMSKEATAVMLARRFHQQV